MNNHQLRTIGLLGGMGPGATVDVMQKIVMLTQAAKDQEHVPILVRSIPQIPDRTMALHETGPSPATWLAAGALALRSSGAGVLAMACNTAHHWYDVVRVASGLPVVHIADAVIAELYRKSAGRGPVMLFATSGTVLSGFYQKRFAAAGIEYLVPDPEVQEHLVSAAIRFVKSGALPAARDAMTLAFAHARKQGSVAAILACTELPTIRLQPASEMPIIDANLALARACVVSAGASIRTDC